MSDDLITAAKAVLAAWDTEDPYERKSEDLFDAMRQLRRAVRVIREVVPSEESHHAYHSFSGS